MMVGIVSWEQHLVYKALLGLMDETSLSVDADSDSLATAYAHCRRLTHYHSRTFFLASSLLPPAQRRAMRALYAFCRISDDVIDRSPLDGPRPLEQWRRRALASTAAANDPVVLAWLDARSRFGIPRLYSEQLLEGVAQDLTRRRYETFAELTDYCYGVASTVGLMSMHITGFAGPHAIPYAVKLGVALQLTNILRDVGEDWRLGRVYLPQEELQRFGLSDEDIAAGRNDVRWQAFMRFQIGRARQLYAESLPGVALLGRQGRFAVAAAAELYRQILDRIEHNNYNVFDRRASTRGRDKLWQLPGIWRRSQLNTYRAGLPAALAEETWAGRWQSSYEMV